MDAKIKADAGIDKHRMQPGMDGVAGGCMGACKDAAAVNHYVP